MAVFLGIDGGGTRTTAWLTNDLGKPLGRAETGPSNPLKVGLAAAQREILKAYGSCIRDAGFSVRRLSAAGPPAVQAVVAGISGTGRQSVRRPLLAWIRHHLPARRHLLTTDAAIALAAALRDEPGIIVIAGTGSIAFARDQRAKVLRAGGWGIPFDDRGSGYDLGLKAVAAALKAFDGRGPQTTLQKRICHHLKLREITGVVTAQLDQQKVAGIFPLMMEAANGGDQLARQLCNDAALDLSALAIALLTRSKSLHLPTRVVMSGGVFKSSTLIRRAFTRHLRLAAPQSRVEMLERAPVEGAIWMAQNLEKKKL